MAQAELTEIEKELIAFEAMVKPLEPEKVVEEAIEPAPSAPVPSVAPCITKDVKKLMGALPENYVGVDIKDLIMYFFENELTECPNA